MHYASQAMDFLSGSFIKYAKYANAHILIPRNSFYDLIFTFLYQALLPLVSSLSHDFYRVARCLRVVSSSPACNAPPPSITPENFTPALLYIFLLQGVPLYLGCTITLMDVYSRKAAAAPGDFCVAGICLFFFQGAHLPSHSLALPPFFLGPPSRIIPLSATFLQRS